MLDADSRFWLWVGLMITLLVTGVLIAWAGWR